jgi:hypothetical protein
MCYFLDNLFYLERLQVVVIPWNVAWPILEQRIHGQLIEIALGANSLINVFSL